MSSHHLGHMLHTLRHGEKHAHTKKDKTFVAIGYIVVGFFLAPLLIGLPLIAYGVYLLFAA
jgi:hypothetical protein